MIKYQIKYQRLLTRHCVGKYTFASTTHAKNASLGEICLSIIKIFYVSKRFYEQDAVNIKIIALTNLNAFADKFQ
jgi:hypothetical protein